MMTDVFISYAREDREVAQQLAAIFERQKLVVWWDRELRGGGDFAREIEQQLGTAKVVTVLWSSTSVHSGFVRDESSRARDRGKLLPIRIHDVALPLGFGTLHTLDLLDWDGEEDVEALQNVLGQVRTRLTTGAEKVPVRPPLRVRWWKLNGGRRRLLASAGLVGVVVAGGGGWWLEMGRRERQQALREARQQLDQGLKDHFSQPPQLESARAAYSEALRLDPAFCRAHYYLGHVYVQLMLNQTPPAQDSVLEALRKDARAQFEAAVRLAGQDAEQLDGSQRVIAAGLLQMLQQTDAVAPLDRHVDEVAKMAPQSPGSVASRASAPGAASAPAGPGWPPRAKAPEDIAKRTNERAQDLYGADREARLAAMSALTLDPVQAADALPGLIARAAGALKQPQTDEAGRLGLVATQELLRRASPSTLRANAAELQNTLLPALNASDNAALKAAATGLKEALARSARSRPIVYLQIAEESQRPVAQALQKRLLAAGYVVPEIENTGVAHAPDQPEMRSQGSSDPDLARWCRDLLTRVAGAPAVLTTLRRAKPATDTYEIWFDKALCMRVSGCS